MNKSCLTCEYYSYCDFKIATLLIDKSNKEVAYMNCPATKKSYILNNDKNTDLDICQYIDCGGYVKK